MLNGFLVVVGSVVTLLLLMAVGYFLAHKKMLTPNTLTQLSSLLLYVVAPALMIDVLMGETRDGPTVRGLLISAAALVAVYVMQGVLMIICYRRADEDTRGVSRFAAIYGNVGFMGVPLIQSVLGTPGMVTTVTSLAVFNIGIWTHGAWLVGGKGSASAKKALLNPGTLGFAAALLLFCLQVPLPGPVRSTISYVGSLNTPLAMIVIGAQMGAVNLADVFRDKKLYGVAAVKLLLIPVLTMLLLMPFKLDPNIFTAVVILSACPTAGATSLMCQLAGKDTSLAARLVTLTTILSVITLPVVSFVSKLITGV